MLVTNNHFSLDFPIFSESLLETPTVLQFLQSRFQRESEACLQGWLESGKARLNGLEVAPEQSMAAGQLLSIAMPGHLEGEADLNWRIVWQNDELMAVYKPPLLPVSRTTRNLYNTLIQLIRRQTPWYDAHLLHRLDTETDGLILIAKNKVADRYWKPRLNELIVRKLYHAQVSGLPEWQEKTLECQLAGKVGSEIRSQSYVVADDGADYIKPQYSKTLFRVISGDAEQSLIECELVTGRKHQIRAHLASLGHPVIGDKIYAHQGHYYLKRLAQPLSPDDYCVLGATHHQLTAVALALQLDSSRAPLVIKLDGLNSSL